MTAARTDVPWALDFYGDGILNWSFDGSLLRRRNDQSESLLFSPADRSFSTFSSDDFVTIDQSPDGRFIYGFDTTKPYGTTIAVMSAASKSVTDYPVEDGWCPSEHQWIGRGHMLAVTEGTCGGQPTRDSRMQFIDAETGRRTVADGEQPLSMEYGVAPTASGRYAVLYARETTALPDATGIVDTSSGRVLAYIPGYLSTSVFDSDESYALLQVNDSSNDQGQLYKLSLSDGQVTTIGGANSGHTSIGLGARGAVITLKSGGVIFWTREGGPRLLDPTLSQLMTDGGPTYGNSVSPDGSVFLFREHWTGPDGNAVWWVTSDGSAKIVEPATVHATNGADEVFVHWSPTGHFVLLQQWHKNLNPDWDSRILSGSGKLVDQLPSYNLGFIPVATVGGGGDLYDPDIWADDRLAYGGYPVVVWSPPTAAR